MGKSPSSMRDSVRIIGGEWRGLKLPVPQAASIRPSPDRVRETLFNWLQPIVSGARCADLFAGTGVLGFEAVSRGAHSALLIDCNPTVASNLRAQAERLESDAIEVICCDAREWIRSANGRFDIVFIDPPYAAGLIDGCCQALADEGRLSPGAHIYIELAAGQQPPNLPAGWVTLREHKAGRVRSMLLRVGDADNKRGRA